MKRKVYATRHERMTDQIIGFLAFPLVNVPLGIILWMISQMIDSQLQMLVSALPWLVNGHRDCPGFSLAALSLALDI